MHGFTHLIINLEYALFMAFPCLFSPIFKGIFISYNYTDHDLITTGVPVNLTDLKAVMRKHKIIVKKWRDIGLELLKNDGELEIIKINNPGNIEACCTEMFKQWLESDLHASWNKIITTLQKIELNVAAKYIEGQCTCVMCCNSVPNCSVLLDEKYS